MRRIAVSRAEASLDVAAVAFGNSRRQEASHSGGMVSEATQERRAAIDRQVGAADGRESRAVLRAADENKVGKLQPWHANHPPEHRPRQEAEGVPGIHRRPRDGSSGGTDAQRPVRRAHGPTDATVALPQGATESVARSP